MTKLSSQEGADHTRKTMNPCREATGKDLPAVQRFLAESGLVHADLALPGSRKFAVLEDGQPPALVAVAGLETFAGCADGLLRSVAVMQPLRGQGLAVTLVRIIEIWAREAGVQTLWLLTTTAPAFFAKLDYRETRRESAPDVIQQSAEFAGLCPASAVCLSKRI